MKVEKNPSKMQFSDFTILSLSVKYQRIMCASEVQHEQIDTQTNYCTSWIYQISNSKKSSKIVVAKNHKTANFVADQKVR